MLRKFCLLLMLCAPPLCAQTDLPHAKMSTSESVVLGLVEGVTEYLPVSSTGHLILASQAMGMGEDKIFRASVNTYLVVIQIGAILAVITIYGQYILKMIRGIFGRDAQGRKLTVNLLIAFFPAAVVGLLLDDLISGVLYGLWYVVGAWFVGGLALLKWNGLDPDQPEPGGGLQMKELSAGQSLIIGLMQVIAMWPGVSRSLVTILGGRMVGLSLHHALIFSFLLGMITLSAATGYKLLDSGADMLNALGIQTILLGIFVAYFSAWIAVKTMVAYLKKHGLGIFGTYRILLAALTALLLVRGVITP